MRKFILLFLGLVGFQSTNAAPKKNLIYVVEAYNEKGEIKEIKVKKSVLPTFFKVVIGTLCILPCCIPILLWIPIKLIYGIWPWQIYDDYLYIVK